MATQRFTIDPGDSLPVNLGENGGVVRVSGATVSWSGGSIGSGSSATVSGTDVLSVAASSSTSASVVITDAPVSSGSAGRPTIAQSLTTYVTTDGDDANDGLSWDKAKATIQAAIDAIPLGPDGISRPGIVEIGGGTFNVTSYSRVDTGCTVNNGSNVILDPNITAQDLGAAIDGLPTGWGTGVYITEVTPGVSFKISSNWAIGNSTNQSLRILRSPIKMRPGITLRGRGRFGHTRNVTYGTPSYATLIKDNGSGVTILGYFGPDADQHASWQNRIVDLSCNGPGNQAGSGNAAAQNLRGFYVINESAVFFERCDFQFHGQWGICMDSNSAVAGAMRDVNIQYNGYTAATVETGGLYLNQSTPQEFELDNVRAGHNFGINAKIPGETQCNKCVFWGAELTAYVPPADSPPSGTGCVIWGGPLAPVVMINTEWQDSAATDFWVAADTTLQMIGGGGSTNAPYAITLADYTARVDLKGTKFQAQNPGQPLTAAIGLAGGATGRPRISWDNCICQQPGVPLFYNATGPFAETIDQENSKYIGTLTGRGLRVLDQGGWAPLDNGFIAANMSPDICTTSMQPNLGRLFYARVYVPMAKTVSSAILGINSKGATLTNCYVGIAKDDGSALIGLSADQSTAFSATNNTPVTVPLTAQGGQSLTLKPGWYQVALLIGGGTAPYFSAPGITTNPFLANANQTANTFTQRFSQKNTSVTAIPSTLPTPDTAGVPFFVALA